MTTAEQTADPFADEAWGGRTHRRPTLAPSSP
ncbi:hypothetical protein Strvi_8113 [Streptomyces violaceusniger Tu 4113]|uniref:Uncharacterized protein n=1 Tax=Streptomyces violaceusniger (strain Tu 4113) TaxID=653045 RepID=G2P8Y2_STRV4|nr:hypothetical protein Strvi_8113 [Streptomyces violaceusniger Tu 4113]